MTHLLSAGLGSSRHFLSSAPLLFDTGSGGRVSQEVADKFLRALLENHLQVVLIFTSIYQLKNESEWRRYISSVKLVLARKTFLKAPKLPPLPNAEVY